MEERNRSDFSGQSSRPPQQLALDVCASGDTSEAQAPQVESVPQPSNVSLEHALLRHAQAHWQAVDRLTRSLHKRARGPQHRSASAASKHSNAQTSAQRTLWVSTESNDAFESVPYRGIQPGGNASRAKQNVSSDPGVEICRHLVAALRLQLEQDQLRQARQDAKRLA